MLALGFQEMHQKELEASIRKSGVLDQLLQAGSLLVGKTNWLKCSWSPTRRPTLGRSFYGHGCPLSPFYFSKPFFNSSFNLNWNSPIIIQISSFQIVSPLQSYARGATWSVKRILVRSFSAVSLGVIKALGRKDCVNDTEVGHVWYTLNSKVDRIKP